MERRLAHGSVVFGRRPINQPASAFEAAALSIPDN